jgi:hypothetical protein
MVYQLSTNKYRTAAVEAGQRLARSIFSKRGNHAEAHLSEGDLAAMLGLAFEIGAEHGEVQAHRVVVADTGGLYIYSQDKAMVERVLKVAGFKFDQGGVEGWTRQIKDRLVQSTIWLTAKKEWMALIE